MRQTKSYIIFFEANDQKNRNNILQITDSNHGFPNIQNKISENTKHKLEISNDIKTVMIQKWQIMLISADCTIKKHCQGWQVRKN